MIRSSFLRVYEPASVFPPEEREYWLAHPTEAGDTGDARPYGHWLVAGGVPQETVRDGAFVRRTEAGLMICPYRTRLRMLAGLLAFRNSIPEEVADAFVPEAEARRAAQELASLDERFPEVRSHILHANWHVPLRWFGAFDGSEKSLVEDRNGLRVRYETRLSEAEARLAQVVEVLEQSWMDEGVIGAVKELVEWLEEFSDEALLELDYGSVAGMFTEDDLLNENCAAQLWTCVDALASGDGATAGRIFGELTDRWATVRAHEVVN